LRVEATTTVMSYIQSSIQIMSIISLIIV